MVDKGKMLPIGQVQGSRGLNNDSIKEEVEVREQSASDSLRVFCCHHPFSSHFDLTFHLFFALSL